MASTSDKCWLWPAYRDNIFICTRQIPFAVPEANLLSKRVWVRIDRHNPQLTLRDVHEKIREIQRENPDQEVFFDGDEFAICSRPKPKSDTDAEPELIDQVQ